MHHQRWYHVHEYPTLFRFGLCYCFGFRQLWYSRTKNLSKALRDLGGSGSKQYSRVGLLCLHSNRSPDSNRPPDSDRPLDSDRLSNRRWPHYHHGLRLIVFLLIIVILLLLLLLLGLLLLLLLLWFLLLGANSLPCFLGLLILLLNVRILLLPQTCLQGLFVWEIVPKRD